MPEYTPVYVVTGSLDSGKTSLLNQLLSRRLESGHSLCCIQFEQGEQALEQDLIDRGNLDLLHFPVRKLQSGAGNRKSFIVRIMVQIEFHAVFLLGG